MYPIYNTTCILRQSSYLHIDDDDGNPHHVEKLRELFSTGCCDGKGCDWPCTEFLTEAEAIHFHHSIQGLARASRYSFICGMISTILCFQGRTAADRKLSRSDPTRSYTSYTLFEKRVCQQFFYCLCGISSYTANRLKRKSKAMLTSDSVDFEEARGGSRSSKFISEEDVKNVVNFLNDFASIHAIPDPGRDPGSSSYGYKVQIPHSCTHLNICAKYKVQCSETVQRSISIPSFKNIWAECRPNIVRLSPTTCGRFSNILSARLKAGSDTAELLSKIYRTERQSFKSSAILQELCYQS